MTLNYKEQLKVLERLNQENHYWCIPREVGVFLYYFLLRTQPRSVVEIGTSIGYSSLWIASALDKTPGSQLYTVESHAERFQIAKKHFQKSQFDNIIQIKGHAPEIFSEYTFPDGIDFLFIDGVKKGTVSYYRAALSQLNSGAIVIVDNVTSHWDVMQKFAQHLDAEQIDYVYHRSLGDGVIIVYPAI